MVTPPVFTQSEVEHLKEHRVLVLVLRKDPSSSEDSVWIKNYTVMKTVIKRLRNAPQTKWNSPVAVICVFGKILHPNHRWTLGQPKLFWKTGTNPRGTLGQKLSTYPFLSNSNNIWPPLRSSKGIVWISPIWGPSQPQRGGWMLLDFDENLYAITCWPKVPSEVCPSFPNTNWAGLMRISWTYR